MIDPVQQRILAEVSSVPWVVHEPALQSIMASLQMRAGRDQPESPLVLHGLEALATRTLNASDAGLSTAALRAAVAQAVESGEPYAKVHGNTERSVARAEGVIAVVPVIGVVATRLSWIEELFGVSAANPNRIAAAVAMAMADPDVKAVIMVVDSPGGQTTGVPEAAEAIYQMRGKKPIYAQVIGMCASAAYWMASAADDICVTPSGMVGSVGAYMYHEDWSAAYAEAGIKPSYIKRGQFKAEFNPEIPLTDEARDHVQELVDDAYDMFTQFVAKARGVDLSVVQGEPYGEGRVFMAARAVERGLADRVRTLGETFQALGPTEVQTIQGRRGGSVAMAQARARIAASARIG